MPSYYVFVICFQDQYCFQAVALLQEYLSDTAISPLQKYFVETEDPFCSEVCYITIKDCMYSFVNGSV